MLPGTSASSRRSAADAANPPTHSAARPYPAAGGTNGALPAPGYILPFRRRAVRHPSQRDLEQAVAQAARLLHDGDVDGAERRFHSLDTISRSWPHLRDQQAAWQFPAWVGTVLCHAFRQDWLLAEMAAREHLSQIAEANIAEVYLAAVALSNEWLENAPHPDGVAPTPVTAEPPRHRFPRITELRDPAPGDLSPSDPVRDYAYALVSAVRFRLGGGEAS